MRRHKEIAGLIACLIISVLINQTLSQTRGGARSGGGFTGPRGGAPGGYKLSGGGSGGSGGASRSTKRRETDQTKEDSLKGAVGAGDEEWVLIKPKLERVRQLHRKARLDIYTAGGGGGGSQRRGGNSQGSGMSGGSGSGGGFSGPGQMGSRRTPQNTTGNRTWTSWQLGRAWERDGARRPDEMLCDELSDMLKNKTGSPEQIKRKMDELREARNETLKELAKAQQDLRKVVTLDQECRLLALGWLD